MSEARLLEANIHFDNKMSKIENLHQSQTFYIKKKKAKLFSTFLVFWLDFIEINICYLVTWSLFICPVFLILIFWIWLLI